MKILWLLLFLAMPAALAQTVSTSINLTITPTLTNTDGSAIAASALTYNLYQGPKAGPFVKVNSAPLTAASTTVASLTAGNCFTATEVETQGTSGGSTVESAPSPTTCVLQPGAPGSVSVSILVTLH